MKREIDSLQRALIAAQVALLEFEDESVGENKAILALTSCLDEISRRFRALKKAAS